MNKESIEIYKFDKDNRLISHHKESNIQKKWLKPLQEIVSRYENFFKGNIHSIYVRGSVANGEAVDNLSDTYESFKRKTNRTTREIQLDISTIKDDINTIYERLPEEKKKK